VQAGSSEGALIDGLARHMCIRRRTPRSSAQDMVGHFEQRLQALDGKAKVVCVSRRICVDLYNEIVRLRPAWHHEDDDKGVIKVVMTGSASGPPEWQPHIRNKERREFLANRFRNPADPFKMSSSATCRSRASTARASTQCTWTSPCAPTG
jgi:hypothetical protein